VTDHASTATFPGLLETPHCDVSTQAMRSNGIPVPTHDITNHEEDIYVGYRLFDSFEKAVSYPFGFGLSYTQFAYSNVKARVSGNTVTVQVTVKNTGSVSGKEVAQVYVAAPEGLLEKPVHELKAFAKTRELKPGQQETLTMQIPVRMLASFDEQQSQWLTEAGTYTFSVGASSRDIRGKAQATVARYVEPVSNALTPKHQLNLLRRGK
jgi:hypothetical protein